MTKLAFPYYEWRYLSQPMWLHGRESAPFNGTGTMVLVLITEAEDHVIECLQNPRTGSDPNSQPALVVDGLNDHLQRAMYNQGGVFQALAAQTVFLHHARRVTALSDRGAFELQPPKYMEPVLVDMLAPSLGWLMWRWQLEALLRTAHCTTGLSREIVKCWMHQFPRTTQLLSSLSIGNICLAEIVRDCTSWGDSVLENMTVSHALADCFRRHGRR